MLLAMCASLAAAPARADDAKPPDIPVPSPEGLPAADTPAAAPAPGFSPQVWLNAGFLSYHFNHAAHYNAYNWGFGIDLRVSEDFTLSAGEYRNSMRYHSTYATVSWQPLHLGPLRIGVAAGAVRGYPDINHGGWSPMAAPVIGVEYRRVGASLIYVPTMRGKVDGCISLQIRIRVW
ncbi:hypothetical protein AB4Z48_03140 [Cupriavidus sp. 2TAF22]|uniref:hypothetical protein n=1 Tax=unclassified Cupriavidus TaxID=2640874 RepID=UPI003F91C238